MIKEFFAVRDKCVAAENRYFRGRINSSGEIMCSFRIRVARNVAALPTLACRDLATYLLKRDDNEFFIRL